MNEYALDRIEYKKTNFCTFSPLFCERNSWLSKKIATIRDFFIWVNIDLRKYKLAINATFDLTYQTGQPS
jgi:hypothetical protein